MLEDDHSLIGGSDDAWSGGVVGMFGRPLSCCIVLCACPLDVGCFFLFFWFFSALFCLPNVGQGYNEYCSVCHCNSLSANLPSDLRLSGEDLCCPPPCINTIQIIEPQNAFIKNHIFPSFSMFSCEDFSNPLSIFYLNSSSDLCHSCNLSIISLKI